MCNGFKAILYLPPKIWEILPQKMQECESLLHFNLKMKYGIL